MLAKNETDYIANIADAETSEYIRSKDDFNIKEFSEEFDLTKEVAEEFFSSLVFAESKVGDSTRKSVVGMFLGGIVDHKNGPAQLDLAAKVVAKFGISEEMFLRRYNYRFYGDVRTCQCMYAPYWYCNCASLHGEETKETATPENIPAVKCFAYRSYGTHGEWVPMRA